ncbi:MAG: autoinducer binding domain-containing protein [Pseudomonadota bacterium]
MSPSDQVVALFDDLIALSPAGYAIGLHLNFTTSKYIFQNYTKDWMEEYSRKGLILSDPTVRWGLENVGAIRWSVLRDTDPGGVIAAAEAFGLKFGVSISIAEGDGRSLGSFAATDREFDEEAISQLSHRLRQMHALTAHVEHDSADDKRIKRFAASLSGIELHNL